MEPRDTLHEEIIAAKQTAENLEILFKAAQKQQNDLKESRQAVIITSRRNITMIGVLTTLNTLLLVINLIVHYGSIYFPLK